MWKTVIAAMCTLVLGVAFPATAQMQSPQTQWSSQDEISGLSLDTEILGKNVDARDAQNVGQVEDVIFGNRGQISQYLVSVGEGAGEKTVALNPDQLQFSEQGQIAFNGSSADLENLPEVNPYDFGVYRGYYEQNPGPYDPYANRPYTGQGPYFNPYRDRYMSGGNQRGSAAGGNQQEPYAGSGYQQNQGQQQGPWQGRQFSQQPYSDQGCGDVGPGRMGMWNGRSQRGWMQPYSGRGISADTFVSAQVVDPQRRTIGEISDIIVDPQNDRVTHAVISLGDKDVLVPFHRLRYVGPSTVLYRGTESQLEQMPEYLGNEGGEAAESSQSQSEQKAGGAQLQSSSAQRPFQEE